MSTCACAGCTQVDIELVMSYIGDVAKESWLCRETLRSIFYTWELVCGGERKRVRRTLEVNRAPEDFLPMM